MSITDERIIIILRNYRADAIFTHDAVNEIQSAIAQTVKEGRVNGIQECIDLVDRSFLQDKQKVTINTVFKKLQKARSLKGFLGADHED